MSAYQFKYFQNIQFRNHGIAPTPPDLPTLKAYPTPGVGGRFEIFSLKWRERMNLKVPGAILPLGCAILSTRAITVRGGWYNPPLRRTRVKNTNFIMHLKYIIWQTAIIIWIQSHCSLRARTVYVHSALPWQNRVTDIFIILRIANCHGRAEWTYMCRQL